MATDDAVSGEGWISDESSFYGDKEEQSRQLDLCDDFNPKSFWSTQHKDLNTLVKADKLHKPEATASKPFSFSSLDRKAMEREQLARSGKSKCDSPQESEHELFNPREGCLDSWQLGESVDDFARRLPPLTTSVMNCPWIWVMNPHRNPRDKRACPSEGNFRMRGLGLLEDHLKKLEAIRTQGKYQPKTTNNRLLREESKVLQEDITKLAAEHNVLSGKWMLFPKCEDVTRVWKLVVEGVINGRLGPVAKVAPDDGSGKEDRLICIYTEDFRDEEDVRRVLHELDATGLLTPGRTIYYKSDAYTYLDIYKDTATKLGLQASLYNSWKMMNQGSTSKPTPVAQKQQSKLSQYF